jgi:group I intron endonuclease
MIGIYKITERSTGRCYIGQSTNIKRRWKEHYKRFSPDLFEYSVEQECCVGLLDVMERYFIKKLNTLTPNGLNKTHGGSGMFGHCDEDTRLKMSASKKGKQPNNAGHQRTDETRLKISIATSGERNPFYSKHHSDEIKKQISASKKGVPWTDARRQAQLNRRNNNDA